MRVADPHRPARYRLREFPDKPIWGYRIAVAEGDLDLAVFTQLVGQACTAKAAGRPGEATALLRRALSLWRGTALTGATGAFVAATAANLQDKQLAAHEELFDTELSLGAHGMLVGELRALTRAYPLRERLVAQLMLALAGSGQQAEALAVYATTRARLADELGVEPTPELAEAHLRVLRQEIPEPQAPATSAVKPAQLPADVAGFAGRGGPLHRLDLLLESGDDGHATAVITAIDGTAWVGKPDHRNWHSFASGTRE